MSDATPPRERSADEIERAQTHLRDLGFECPIDGRLGEATIVALRAFQTKMRLPPTGQLDEATWEALFTAPAQPTTPAKVVASRPRLHAVADQPEIPGNDLLGFDAYAAAIAGLIDNPKTGTPLTLAISAPWGAGKSTLAAMVRERLERKPAAGGSKPHVTCTFNAWMHDDARNLGAAFAAEIAREAHRRRPLLWRLFRPIPWGLAGTRDRIRQLGVLGAVVFVLLCVSAWFGGLARVIPVLDVFGKLSPEQLQALKDLGSSRTVGTVVAAALAMLGKVLLTMGGSLSGFVKDPETAAARGSLTRVREQLGSLIRQATPRGSRFVIFVDDLERCRPPRPVDLLEIVSQMLGHEGVVTVIMADMPAVAACAEIKYKALAERYNPADRINVPPTVKSTYGRLYLQKIVQLQFDIPAQLPEHLQALIDNLVTERRKARPEPVEPWGTRIRRRVRLIRVDFAAGFHGILAPPESRKLWALGGAAALVLFADAVGLLRGLASILARDVGEPIGAAAVLVTALATDEPSVLWNVRAGAVGLAAGAWVAFALSGRKRPAALPPEVASAILVAIAAVVIILDRVAFDPVRSVLAAGDWYWLRSAIASPGTSWFWYSLAVTIAGSGLYFVLSSAALAPAHDAPGEPPAEGEVGDVRRAAHPSWWLLGITLLALAIDRLVLVEGGAVWRIFDGGDAEAPAHYAALMAGWWTAGLIAVAALVAWTAGGCWACGREARLAQARKAFDSHLASGKTPPRDAAFDAKQFDDLVKERELLLLINDSTLLDEAYEEVRAHLHQLPRNAKRAMNRLRLLLYVAYARGAFGGSPELTHRHLGRWVAFQEHWPEVAALMIGDPGLMGALERCTTAAERQALFTLFPEEMARSVAADADLADFLASPRLPLGPVTARLIHLPRVSGGRAGTTGP